MDDNTNNIISDENNSYSLQHIYETFMAFVDAYIPRTPLMAEVYGDYYYFGALDLHTDEYLVMALNHFNKPMAAATAEWLDVVAKQLLFFENNEKLLNFTRFPDGGVFAALSPEDRFRTLLLFDHFMIFFSNMLVKLRDYPEMYAISSVLNRLTTLGFYSEWFGYGTTRMLNPNERRLECHPASWVQVDYPGPSISYIDLVNEYQNIRKTE